MSAVAVLSEDESRALREALVRFLRWRQAMYPEDLASETMVRVLQNLSAGVVIDNMGAYSRQVARNVQMEDHRERDKQARLVRGSLDVSGETTALREQIASCLEHCKKECLSRNQRRLVELYYGSDEEMKIPDRKRLAKELKISESALHQKVFQIRRKLGACVKRCLDQSGY